MPKHEFIRDRKICTNYQGGFAMTKETKDSSYVGNTYVKKKEEVRITSGDDITICITNDIIDVMTTRKRNVNGLSDIMRIDKDHYVIISTGEIREYARTKESEGLSHARRKSMNKKFSYLRQYINMNFKGEDCERHITLTYAEPTKDMSKCKNDFKKFWKRLIYHYEKMEYIAVFEPHQKGTWHIHVLVKDEKVQHLRLSKKNVEEIWGNGFVKITNLKNHNDIGLYFQTLLGDEKYVDKHKKSSRLEYYPLHTKIYTSSKEMKKPTFLHIDLEELKEIIGNRKRCFERSYSIRMCETNQEVNRVNYITYNDRVNPYTR